MFVRTKIIVLGVVIQFLVCLSVQAASGASVRFDSESCSAIVTVDFLTARNSAEKTIQYWPKRELAQHGVTTYSLPKGAQSIHYKVSVGALTCAGVHMLTAGVKKVYIKIYDCGAPESCVDPLEIVSTEAGVSWDTLRGVAEDTRRAGAAAQQWLAISASEREGYEFPGEAGLCSPCESEHSKAGSVGSRRGSQDSVDSTLAQLGELQLTAGDDAASCTSYEVVSVASVGAAAEGDASGLSDDDDGTESDGSWVKAIA